MNIKSHPEVVYTEMAYTPLDREFEAHLSMTVSRPYAANLGYKNPKYNFPKISETMVETLFRPGRDWIPAGRGS